jgi:hypothetical protein
MKIKGIAHVHSTYSYDGTMTLLELRDFLVQKGISFCFLSEHTDEMTLDEAQRFAQECKALSGSSFVFIPGFEVPYRDTHVLFFGTEVFLAQKANEEMLYSWSNAASLTILAHPVRNRFIIDAALESVLDGVEIWNQQYEGKKVPRMRSVRFLSHLQKKNPTLLALGGLDFHRKEHFGSPVYSIEVETLTIAAIVSQFKAGEYTFGRDGVAVSSLGLWKGNNSFIHRTLSVISIATIVGGKKINALLAHFGVRLPKGLLRAVRSRV